MYTMGQTGQFWCAVLERNYGLGIAKNVLLKGIIKRILSF